MCMCVWGVGVGKDLLPSLATLSLSSGTCKLSSDLSTLWHMPQCLALCLGLLASWDQQAGPCLCCLRASVQSLPQPAAGKV